ncbi:MAG: nuclear transport factor 2 family protein [Desulfovibrio sp.]|nr:nuclear transport factor 2 family protein [Desulfovibrio sp.]
MRKFICIPAAALIITITLIAAQTKGETMPVKIADNAACAMTQDEKAGILKSIGYYLQAAPDGSRKTAEKGFAEKATMSWSADGKLNVVPIDLLYEYFDEKKRPASGEITACSVAGDVAMVRLESDFDGALFTDMFTLVKDGDDWKIVSKVYHLKN